MKVLIQHGARLSEEKEILDISVSRGYQDIVDFVLSQDYVDFKDKEKAIRDATSGGHLGVLKTLIAHGQSLPVTSLHLALSSTRVEIVLLLLETGADVCGLDRKGNTPVDYCIPRDRSATEELIGRYAEIIQMLIQNGASPNGGGKNQPPLHQASYWGHLKLVSLMKSLGADVNLVYDGASVELTNVRVRKVSPLHDACKGGHEDVVAFLLDNGAEIDATDSNGDSPLMCAVATTNKLSAIILDGATTRFPREKFDNISVVKFLVERGADLNTRNRLGQTALLLAAGNRNREQFLCLLRAGARLDLTSLSGDDPLLLRDGWGRGICSR